MWENVTGHVSHQDQTQQSELSTVRSGGKILYKSLPSEKKETHQSRQVNREERRKGDTQETLKHSYQIAKPLVSTTMFRRNAGPAYQFIMHSRFGVLFAHTFVLAWCVITSGENPSLCLMRPSNHLLRVISCAFLNCKQNDLAYSARWSSSGARGAVVHQGPDR